MPDDTVPQGNTPPAAVGWVSGNEGVVHISLAQVGKPTLEIDLSLHDAAQLHDSLDDVIHLLTEQS